MVADVLAPNRHLAISNHHGDLTMISVTWVILHKKESSVLLRLLNNYCWNAVRRSATHWFPLYSWVCFLTAITANVVTMTPWRGKALRVIGSLVTCYWLFGHQLPVDSLHKGPVTWSFDVFFVVSQNKLLHKHSNCQWFDTPLHSCVMYVKYFWGPYHLRPNCARHPNIFLPLLGFQTFCYDLKIIVKSKSQAVFVINSMRLWAENMDHVIFANRLSVKSCENLVKMFDYDFIDPIRSQICNCHKGRVVWTCAKLWFDLIIIFWSKV